MNLKFIVSTIVFLLFTQVHAQTIIFSESMGVVTGTKQISVHEFENGFDNPDLSMTDGGAAAPADVRSTQVISSTPNNNANIYFTASGTLGFAIENIDAAGFSGLTLQFNYYKENGSVHATFAVQYWNGSAWINIADTAATLFSQPVNNGTGWYLSKLISLPVASQVSNLKLRFLKSGSIPIRIDNVVLKGNNTCAPASNTISPQSGPVGTEITVNAVTSNLIGATATVGGIPAVVTQVSNTQIKVIVPPGAQTGAVVTTIAGGCNVSNSFTVINNLISSCQGSGSVRNKIFISEVTDHGTGGHTYIELYNATGSAVNLADYKVNIHNNGATVFTSSITLPSYNLPNNSVYLVAIGGTDATIQYASIPANITSGVGGLNGNDHIRLLDNTNTWIDLWGATSNTFFTPANKNYFYRRKNVGITAPSTTWNPNDWTFAVPVNYSDIGSYNYSVGVAPIVNTQPSYSPTCITATLTVGASEGFVGGNALTYQWFYAAPGATAWTAVPATAPFSGVTTATLQISDISELDNYQYYTQVRENTATCYTASNATMIRIPTSVWNGTAWVPSAPTSATAVTINGTYNTATNGSFEACSLTINPSRTLTITPNAYVKVETKLTISGNLIIEDSGSLVQVNENDTNVGTGTNFKVNRIAKVKNFDYVYWSAPTDGFDVINLPNNNRYFWSPTALNANGTQGNWLPATGIMNKGQGYIARISNASTNAPLPTAVQFEGSKPINGTFTFPISRGTSPGLNDCWNLLGNPYPSAIDADNFLQDNSKIEGSVRVWMHGNSPNASTPSPFYQNFVYNYDVNDYIIYNGTATTIPAAFSGSIASGQGFFVRMLQAGEGATSSVTDNSTITFRNAFRRAADNSILDNSEFYRNASADTSLDKSRIWLNLIAPTGQASNIAVGYVSGATLEKDRLYDALIDVNTFSFYSLIDELPMAIQGRPVPFDSNDAVPMGMVVPSDGTYVVAISAVDGVFLNSEQNIYLQDKWLGTTHNLKTSPYTFTSAAGTFNQRFVLRYTNESLAISEPNFNADLQLLTKDHRLIIKSANEMANVQLYDMLGRKVFESKIDGTHFTTFLPTTNGTMIAKITFADANQVSRKIVF